MSKLLTDDGLPNPDMGGKETGIEAAQMDHLDLAIATFNAGVSATNDAMTEAEKACVELRSLAVLVDDVVKLATTIIPLFAKAPSPATATDGATSAFNFKAMAPKLLTSLSGIGGVPAADRKGFIINAIMGSLI